MIVDCNNCNKKFDINENLIPVEGRLLQCSGCNKKWFFKKKIKKNDLILKINKKNLDSGSFLKKKNLLDIEGNFKKKKVFDEKFIKDEKITIKKESKILKKFLIFLISFISLIILVDTFKYYLIKIIPNVEFILYNLYESITYVFLFVNDLI